eukprot:scaffold10198_cov82-Isochrysis_galbana.AAC.2
MESVPRRVSALNLARGLSRTTSRPPFGPERRRPAFGWGGWGCAASPPPLYVRQLRRTATVEVSGGVVPFSHHLEARGRHALLEAVGAELLGEEGEPVVLEVLRQYLRFHQLLHKRRRAGAQLPPGAPAVACVRVPAVRRLREVALARRGWRAGGGGGGGVGGGGGGAARDRAGVVRLVGGAGHPGRYSTSRRGRGVLPGHRDCGGAEAGSGGSAMTGHRQYAAVPICGSDAGEAVHVGVMGRTNGRGAGPAVARARPVCGCPRRYGQGLRHGGGEGQGRGSECQSAQGASVDSEAVKTRAVHPWEGGAGESAAAEARWPQAVQAPTHKWRGQGVGGGSGP